MQPKLGMAAPGHVSPGQLPSRWQGWPFSPVFSWIFMVSLPSSCIPVSASTVPRTLPSREDSAHGETLVLTVSCGCCVCLGCTSGAPRRQDGGVWGLYLSWTLYRCLASAGCYTQAFRFTNRHPRGCKVGGRGRCCAGRGGCSEHEAVISMLKCNGLINVKTTVKLD